MCIHRSTRVLEWLRPKTSVNLTRSKWYGTRTAGLRFKKLFFEFYGYPVLNLVV
jgi:hypothetical protein